MRSSVTKWVHISEHVHMFFVAVLVYSYCLCSRSWCVCVCVCNFAKHRVLYRCVHILLCLVAVFVDCVSPKVAQIMRSIISLCFIGVAFSLMAFLLDLAGPANTALKNLRRNAVFNILTGEWALCVCVRVCERECVCVCATERGKRERERD